jgi:hypothetical protein
LFSGSTSPKPPQRWQRRCPRPSDGDGDPHDEIVRLEARIEELTQTIANCRKFILASRVSHEAGNALWRNAVRSGILAAAVAALLVAFGQAEQGPIESEWFPQSAARECFDRMDGNVTQSVDATQVRGDVTFTWKPPAKC